MSPILDLGCGPGVTVHHLRSRGIDCYGSDLVTYRRRCPTSPTRLVRPGRLRAARVVTSSIPHHTCFSTSSSTSSIRLLRPSLRRGVSERHDLLITVPARQELWSNYDEFYDHQRRYDVGSATSLCRAAGLEVMHPWHRTGTQVDASPCSPSGRHRSAVESRTRVAGSIQPTWTWRFTASSSDRRALRQGAAEIPNYKPGDVDDPLEIALVEEIYDALGESTPGGGGAKAGAAQRTVGHMLQAIAATPFFGNAAQRVVIWFLKQVAAT